MTFRVSATCPRCEVQLIPTSDDVAVLACQRCGEDWLVEVCISPTRWGNMPPAPPAPQPPTVEVCTGHHPLIGMIIDLEDERPWLRSRPGRASVPVGCIPTAEPRLFEVRAA